MKYPITGTFNNTKAAFNRKCIFNGLCEALKSSGQCDVILQTSKGSTTPAFC